MPINGEIRADKIRLISESGEQLGIVGLNEALAKAEEASLDLVQMAKDGDPLGCRLLNHGKHVFDAKKQKAASKKKQKRQQIKEIKFRPVTEKNDYEIKVNKIKSFIENGDKAKITLRFRGREMEHQHIGRELLTKLTEQVADFAKVEVPPKSEGKQIMMVLVPQLSK